MAEDKIERIELYHLGVPLPTPLYPVWIPGYPQTKLAATLLVITTRGGLTGYATGPAFERERSGIGDFIGQFLLGLDPFDVDRAREALRQASYLGWRNNWMEIAFWDLAAKAKDIPLHQLMVERLGGEADSSIPEAVEVFASFRELRPPRARAEVIERAQRIGFKAAKICVHSMEEGEDHKQLEVARSVAGPDFDLMVHAHQGWSVSLVEDVPRWDLPRARRFVYHAAELGYKWVQEPLHEEDWDGLAELNSTASIPIAGGDLSVSASTLRALVRQGCYSILTPGSSLAGMGRMEVAISEARKQGCGFSPTTKGDGINLAANLHALVAWKRLVGEEDATRLAYPWEPPASIPENRDALLMEPLHLNGQGCLPVPQGPGLGVYLDPNALKRYGERFYSLTPVRLMVSSARRSGLKQAVEMAQRKKRA